uniref:MFS domain-containing protein n=1 Tax=Macrostomum lignano TaxID=282301 RepID=A0A1I8FA06_9PLAT
MYTMTQVVRTGLVMANVFSVLAAISIAPTLAANSPIFVYITRALSGLHNGLTIPMTSMYVTEIVPIRLRGAIGSSGQLSITIGIFVGGLVGLEQALNREKYWVVAIALSGLPSLVSSIALPLLPESPRRRGCRQAGCAAILRSAEVDEAMLALKSEKVKMEQQEAAEKFSIGTLFTSKRYRMALLITLVLVVVMQYSSIMLENTGVQKSTKFGRRLLLLLSLAIVLVSLVALLIVSQFTPKSFSTATGHPEGSVWSCLRSRLHLRCRVRHRSRLHHRHVHQRDFPAESRGAANSVAMGVLQTSNALVVLTYYTLEKSLGHFVYLIYITKNRSTDDIADELSAKLGGPRTEAGDQQKEYCLLATRKRGEATLISWKLFKSNMSTESEQEKKQLKLKNPKGNGKGLFDQSLFPLKILLEAPASTAPFWPGWCWPALPPNVIFLGGKRRAFGVFVAQLHVEFNQTCVLGRAELD